MAEPETSLLETIVGSFAQDTFNSAVGGYLIGWIMPQSTQFDVEALLQGIDDIVKRDLQDMYFQAGTAGLQGVLDSLAQNVTIMNGSSYSAHLSDSPSYQDSGLQMMRQNYLSLRDSINNLLRTAQIASIARQALPMHVAAVQAQVTVFSTLARIDASNKAGYLAALKDVLLAAIPYVESVQTRETADLVMARFGQTDLPATQYNDLNQIVGYKFNDAGEIVRIHDRSDAETDRSARVHAATAKIVADQTVKYQSINDTVTLWRKIVQTNWQLTLPETINLPCGPILNPDTPFYIQVQDRLFFDVGGGPQDSGAALAQYAWHGGDNQRFRFHGDGWGDYLIIPDSGASGNQTLDVWGASKDEGSRLIQFPHNGEDNQKWFVFPGGDGYFAVCAKHSWQAIGADGNSYSNGAYINQHEWPKDTSQASSATFSQRLRFIAALEQSNWRWCSKCQAIFYAGTNSACPTGGQHTGTSSGNYLMFYMAPGETGLYQDGWGWCNKCSGLVYTKLPAGPCPSGGSHTPGGTNYVAVPGKDGLPNRQSGWRWCSKCQAMWFSQAGTSVCPAGGAHSQIGSGAYSIKHTPQ